MKSKKNIAIIGIGGVESYFGGKIAYNIEKNNNKDYNAYFIARGNHLMAIKEKGYVLNTYNKSRFVCRPALVTEDITEIPKHDIIVLAETIIAMSGETGIQVPVTKKVYYLILKQIEAKCEAV